MRKTKLGRVRSRAGGVHAGTALEDNLERVLASTTFHQGELVGGLALGHLWEALVRCTKPREIGPASCHLGNFLHQICAYAHSLVYYNAALGWFKEYQGNTSRNVSAVLTSMGGVYRE